MGALSNLVRNFKLWRIGIAMSPKAQIDYAQEYKESMQEMVTGKPSARTSRKQAAERKLFEMVVNTPQCRAVMEYHKANEDVLKGIMMTLALGGAGQIVGGMYVPAGTLAYPAPLDYVLTHFHNRDPDYDTKVDVCHNLVQYFRTYDMKYIALSPSSPSYYANRILRKQ